MDFTQQDILLIEDDPAVAASLQQGLGNEGFSVIWSRNGHEGIAEARLMPPG